MKLNRGWMMLIVGGAVAAVMLVGSGMIVEGMIALGSASEQTSTTTNTKMESSLVTNASSSAQFCSAAELWNDFPVLCHMLQRAANDLDRLAADLYREAFEQGWILHWPLRQEQQPQQQQQSSKDFAKQLQRRLRHGGIITNRETTGQLPVVMAHGMGDSCFNSGMQHITQRVSDLLGGPNQTYSVCIPTGDTQSEDTKNGYFLNMDASVQVFASKIRADPALQGGFHAVGFSQGNNLIRGYIAQFNDPPVHTFLSVNGVNAGIGAVPYCRPKSSRLSSSTISSSERILRTAVSVTSSAIGDVDANNENESTTAAIAAGGSFPSMCDLLMEQASRNAYTEFAQEHSFQANYWRDPRIEARDHYRKYSQLARWNNEVLEPNAINDTLRENWAKTNAFVWVLATEDGMVWPREGEQWGAPDPADPFLHILPMNETEWYLQDLFGLRTAHEAGKNYFEQFQGDHLAFTEQDFDRWITTYLKNV